MDKKAISEHLIDALNKEDLPRREAARFLNLNPCYVTMAQNENSWDAMGKTAWERMEAWHETRLKISEFKIPEGEEIWKPKEKTRTIQDNPDQWEKDKRIIKERSIKARRMTEKEFRKMIANPDEEDEHSLNNMGFNNLEQKEKAHLFDMYQETEKIAENFRVPGSVHSESARLKVALDIEINLIINGQKVQLR